MYAHRNIHIKQLYINRLAKQKNLLVVQFEKNNSHFENKKKIYQKLEYRGLFIVPFLLLIFGR